MPFSHPSLGLCVFFLSLAHWHDKGADWRGLAHTQAHILSFQVHYSLSHSTRARQREQRFIRMAFASAGLPPPALNAAAAEGAARGRDGAQEAGDGQARDSA